MGRLTKIFKGSSHRISEGQYVGNYREEHVRDAPSTPPEYKVGYDNEDIDRATALSLSEEDHWKAKAMEAGSHLEDDEQLARALQESLSANSPPHENGNSHGFQPIPYLFSSNLRICAGCRSEIGHGRYLSCMGGVWHPECFCCHSCNQPILDSEFSMLRDDPYHKSCYKDQYHPKCDVCKQFIPTNTSGLIEYRAHPFWLQKYCPFHAVDGTPRCCSCDRMEPTDTTYVTLDDGRKLCLECLDCSIMDDSKCPQLLLDIQEFYEDLNMKITQEVPFRLVERQALNEVMEGEQSGYHHMPETRGLCVLEKQTFSTILKPKIKADILILKGLPRLLTGSILAHEMMHAWLQLNGFRISSLEVEEGICHVLAHMWLLKSEIMSGTGSHVASRSSSSSSSVPSSSSSSGMPKKAAMSYFEKKLGEFFKHQIESDTSSGFGDSFRAGNSAVLKYGLRATLEHIKLTGSFPL